MRFDQVGPGRLDGAHTDGASVCHAGHHHGASLSRRRFLQAAAGVTALGALGMRAGMRAPWAAAAASSPGIGLAEPTPGLLDFGTGDVFHVQAPPFTGVDTDPGTVFNFEGVAALALVSGMCERKDRRTGQARELPYLFNDMRFQQGKFRGRDGHERDVTFAFI